MSLLDTILGRRITPETRDETRPFSREIPNENDKEVIRVDPNQSLKDYPRRPPIIFENGLG